MPAPGPDAPNRVLLRLQEIYRTYEGEVPVHALRPTTFAIEAGDFVSIEGASGSGKSTLMNMLGLLDRPTGGSYAVGGQETASLGECERTSLRGSMFGFVFQSFHLLSDRTVTENVELGLLYRGGQRRTRRSLAQAVLGKVGLSHRREVFPPTLSGGERQRVAIARAMVGAPRVLLCDEPTGNLDRKSSDMILSLLEALNEEGLTVVTVTHDPGVARRAHRHFHVADGVVSE